MKSPSLFRPGYASIQGSVLHLDMPGVCRGNLKRVPFKEYNVPSTRWTTSNGRRQVKRSSDSPSRLIEEGGMTKP